MATFYVLEANLKRAIAAAAGAQANLDAARKRAGLPTEPRQFYSAAEVRAAMRLRDDRERQNYLGLVEACRAAFAPTRGTGKYAHLSRARSNRDDPTVRAQIAWIDTLVKADAIVRERARDDAPRASAAAIIRAGKIRRGEIVELPADETARAILIAGRKRRNEDDTSGEPRSEK